MLGNMFGKCEMVMAFYIGLAQLKTIDIKYVLPTAININTLHGNQSSNRDWKSQKKDAIIDDLSAMLGAKNVS